MLYVRSDSGYRLMRQSRSSFDFSYYFLSEEQSTMRSVGRERTRRVIMVWSSCRDLVSQRHEVNSRREAPVA